MGGLRALVEKHLATTLESTTQWGLPIVLTDPDGDQREVTGQVLYPAMTDTLDGMEVVTRKTVVTLRRSTLTRVPVDGEKWSVTIPVSPVDGAATETYIGSVQPNEGGESIGFIRVYLNKAEQS